MSVSNSQGEYPLPKKGFDLIESEMNADLRSLKYLDNTDHLNCPICQQPFLSPLTTVCGHTFCKECIEECFKANGETNNEGTKGFCPLDRTPMNSSDVNDLFPAPLIISNIVDDLRVICLNEERGCLWVGHRWEVTHHVLRECQYTRVFCNGARAKESEVASGEDDSDQKSGKSSKESTPTYFSCQILTERRFVEEANGECVHKKLKCELCEKEITKINQQIHLDHYCPRNYSKCDICNNDTIQKKNLDEHRSNCLRSGRFVCTANEIGCNWLGDTEPSLENHLKNGNCQLSKLFPNVKELESRIDDVIDENRVLKRQINLILDGIVQGKVTNLGYNQQIEEIGSFTRDLDQDRLVNITYEVESLRSELEEKVNPFIERETGQANNRQNIINNLVNDSFLMKDEMNLQRALLNSVRKQLQFIMFRNRSQSMFSGSTPHGSNTLEYEEPNLNFSSRSSSEERLNLKL